MGEEGVHFYCNVVFLKVEKKVRGRGYGFELYASMKLNATQKWSQKVASITYTKKL